MAETIETLIHRIDLLEKRIDTVTHQLSYLVEALGPDVPDSCKSDTKEHTTNKANKKEATKIINELLEKMGIADVEPIPIEELHKSMATRIRAEDNEFSRAIIEEREK